MDEKQTATGSGVDSTRVFAPIPSNCTSLGCRPPKRHCADCSHAEYKSSANVNGTRIYWVHMPLFGPVFSKKRRDDDPQWCPHSRHAVWKHFQKWYDRKFKKFRANLTAVPPSAAAVEGRHKPRVGHMGAET